MNSNQIHERWHESTDPFTLRLDDGTRVPVPHPDFRWVPPGIAQFFVYDKNGKATRRIDPLHVIAIGEGIKAKQNGKH